MNHPKEKPAFPTRFTWLVAGACCGAASLPAAAQNATPAAAEGLEEVIVTARFKAEKLQETPIAITAITAGDLAERGMQNSYEIAYTVPNASLRPAQAAFGASMSAYIRGVGQYDFLPEFEPGVAIYFDDVLHPVTFASSVDLMDLERVEVLRGPQGTLFGRGSIGGAIRYISKAPEGSDSGNISVTYGDFNRIDVRASYDFKLSDTVFARVTGVAKKRDGYQTVYDFACKNPLLAGYGDGLAADGADADTLPDVVAAGSAADNAFAIPRRTRNREADCKIGTQGGQDVTGARAALRFAPNDKFDLTFTAEYINDNSEARADTLVHIGRVPTTSSSPFAGQMPPPFGSWSNVQVARTGIPFDNRFVPDSPYVSYATYQDPVTGFTTDPKTSFEQKALSAKAVNRFSDSMQLEVIGSYAKFTGAFATDTDQTPYSVQLVDGIQLVDTKSLEARLSGTITDKFDWTAGAYYYEGEFTNSQQVSIPAFVPNALLVNGKNTTSSTNLSGFAHGVFHLNDKLSLTAGLRYSTDEKDEQFDNSIVITSLDTDTNHFDWKAGIDYKLTDGLMAYASASTSYRPQAFNPRPFQVTQFVPVDGEEATSYELGFKSDFADNRVRVNLAAFYVDYNQRILPVGGTECLANSQGVYTGLVPAGTPGALTDSLGQTCTATTSRTYYNNIPATIQGAELEVQFAPVEGMTISAQYGYTDFQGDEFDNPGLLGNPNVTQITSDNPIYVPRDNYSMSFAYKFKIGEGSSLTPRLDYYGQSQICTGIRTNISVTQIDTTEDQACSRAYELLNARLEWSSPEDTWKFAVGATNLTDEEYYLNKFDLSAFGQPTVEGQPGAPREWYVQFTRNFN
ncbi:MAG TPA: TonB-dependent receptor [Steroidobacteraceae bacterium]|nr:TonB-dependent receptor [Steroidobacteraceae bacterium]